MTGESNYLKKKLASLQADFDKLQKQLSRLETSPSNQMLSHSASLCGGCGTEILDDSSSQHSGDKGYQSQIFSTARSSHLEYHHPQKKTKGKHLILQHTDSQGAHFNYPPSSNQQQDLEDESRPMGGEHDHLINDFVDSIDLCVIKHTTIEFPKDKLAALLEDNAQTKQDMERLLEKLHTQEFLLDEYKRALDQEIKKGNDYKALLAQKNSASSGLVIGGRAKKIDEMQRLVS